MQVVTLVEHLGLGSELADCYRDATFLPYGHLMVDLSPQTKDKLRYSTNIVSTSSKFWRAEQLKHLHTLDDAMNTQNLSNLQLFQHYSHRCKSFFLQWSPKEFIENLWTGAKKIWCWKTCNAKNKEKFQKKCAHLLLENNLEAEAERSVIRKGHTAPKS